MPDLLSPENLTADITAIKTILKLLNERLDAQQTQIKILIELLRQHEETHHA